MIYGEGVYVIRGQEPRAVQDAIIRAAHRFAGRKRSVKMATKRMAARVLPRLGSTSVKRGGFYPFHWKRQRYVRWKLTAEWPPNHG